MKNKYSSVDVENLKAKAMAVLARNHKRGTGELLGRMVEYDYTCPARGKYPHQWLWDSSFHAIALAKVEPERAKRELETLLAAVGGDGFLPSIIRWEDKELLERLPNPLLFSGRRSNLTQPPVVATAVEEVYQVTKDQGFVERCLPALEKYYNWMARERDPDDDGLVSIIHPWEAADDSPAFDGLLLGKAEARPAVIEVYWQFYRLLWEYWRRDWSTKKILDSNLFNVESVMFNCIYAQGLGALARLERMMGKKKSSERYDQMAKRVEKAIVEVCWDPERKLFFDVSHRGSGHEQYRVATISALFPLILDNVPAGMVDKLVKDHLVNTEEFWLPYPVAFVSRSEAAFNPDENALLWRGPVWVNTNWFLVRGLWKCGYREVAKQLARRTVEMVDRSGFREFYNPFTGKGEGQRDYGWTTLVVDLLDYC